MKNKIAVLMMLCLMSFAGYAEESKPVYKNGFRSYSGSIAINLKTGVTGGARNFNTEKEATNSALFICNKKNNMKSGCKTSNIFSNSCAAVAWSPKEKNAFGGWHDDSLEKAKIHAIKGCTAEGASDCKIVESFCTSWETEEVIWW